MSPWLSDILLCCGLLLLAYVCFQSERHWVRRVGLWLVIGGIGLGLWFWTGSLALVVGGILMWFAVPVGQAMYFSRKLRFSRHRHLTPGRLDPHDFEDLSELTADLRHENFAMDADYRLEPSPVEQAFRLFRHREMPFYGGIAMVRQGMMSLYYVMLITPDREGNVWLTWDYPLAYGLKMPPQFKIYRCLEARSAAELIAQHREFLKLNDVAVPEEPQLPETLAFFDEFFKSTIRYNLNIGLLEQTKHSEDEVAYSWRGTFFISWQVLMELVLG